MPRGETKHLKQHQFKKGGIGNPLGGNSHNPITKALLKLTVQTYREVIELVLTGNLAKLKAMAEHPNTPAIQVGVATAFMKAIKNGDYAVIEKIAERIVGKIPDQINIKSENNTTIQAQVAAITDQTLRERLTKLRDDV